MNTTLISTKHRAKQLRPRGAPRVQAMSTDLWAFDFDGVVCNSVGESSKSAWKVGIKMPPETGAYILPPDICNSLIAPGLQASARKWPDLFSKSEVQAKEAGGGRPDAHSEASGGDRVGLRADL